MKRDLSLTQWLRSENAIGRLTKLHKLVNPHGWLAFFVTITIILTSISPAIATPIAMKDIIASPKPGIPSTYTAFGASGAPSPGYSTTTPYTLNFSQGSPNNNLEISGFTTASNTFSLLRLTNQIRIRRHTTGSPSDYRQLLFYQRIGSSGNTRDFAPSKADDMESALLNTIVNRGTDNVFANTGNQQGNNNNIERVDFIDPSGLTAPAAAGLPDIGFLIMERGGNDAFKIAAITAVDSSNNPTALGSPFTATGSTWGRSTIYNNVATTVMRADTIGTDLSPSSDATNQPIGGIYFSYADLGITAGQKFYGYALLPGDVPVGNNLVDWTTFPNNTTEGGGGGMDLIAGGGIYVNNSTPVADLALQKTVDNANPSAGTNITFTLTLTNQSTPSTGNATGVQVQDSLPAGLQFVSSTSTGSYNSLTGIWNVGSLVHSSTVTLQITAKVIGSGSITNTAQVSASDQLDSDSSPNNNNPAEDDQSSVSITVASPPNIRLVKRLTKIQTTVLSGYVDVVTGAGAIDDNASGWANPTATAVKSDNSGNTTNFSSLLQGAVTATALPVAQRPKPGDEVEYTIYFLSDGGKDASNVSLCDFVPANTTYVPGSIQLSLSGTLTAVPDSPALGSGFYPNSTPVFPASCMGVNNSRGAAVVSVGSAPKATASGAPTNSYGFFRFRAKVD